MYIAEDYYILSMDPASLTYRLVMQYSSSTDTIAQIAPIRWPGDCNNFVYRQMLAKLGSKYLEYNKLPCHYNRTSRGPCDGNSTLVPPPDWPVCGRLGELCAVAGPNIPLIVSVLLAVLVVILVIAAGLVYRHYREEAAIASMHWKISEDEIMPTKLCGGW